MYSLLKVVFLLVTMTVAHNSEDFCNIDNKSCGPDISNDKYVFYDVNPPEGFNLRRDVYMRFAIMLAEAHKVGKNDNWRLVLPPWKNLYHWKTKSSRSPAVPWGHFFNINSLKSFAPVVELHEVFDKTEGKSLKIDRVYVLQNFADAFENGDFTDKWEISRGCSYGGFWGYNNVTSNVIECVNFQGKISKLWELIALHPSDRYVMFAHAEIPLHDTYGTKTFWDCRRSMKFNENLVTRAEDFISKYLNCDTKICNNYASVHWRRQDFARYRKNDVPSIKGTAKQIHKQIKQFNSYINTVFIATDADMTSLRQLELELTQLGYLVYYFKPSTADLDKYKDGGIAIIDQIICSHAAYFIGTHESTFTFRIQEEREILGHESRTTFNRLCPDKGRCEKPSKWTIVH
ncbi:GDP-fucose protein O-fucosyltransferase 2 [Zerene cesonia]|uniref:GDP-fucose protein O-fucosyltransferase 2 n=1 Tax=Zerene cesonia TaxID=33412 RepID=UPI0018E54156|nr:GDP-fucose protein O-fucosyltransferase 2 [Zerene cesonia]